MSIHQGTPSEDYHAAEGLSSTGAKRILDCPNCWRNAPVEHKDAFDVGALAHRLILGDGDPVHVVDAYDWKKKAHQVERDYERSQGNRAVHRGDLRAASRMSQSVLRHPQIGELFTRPGVSEASVYATDPDTGVQVRCRPDRLTEDRHGPLCIDVKTTAGGTHPRDLCGKYGVINRLGYHQSAAWYVDTLALAGIEDARFLLVFVSKQYPHEPRAVLLDEGAIDEGRAKNRDALDLYKKCTDSGEWPCSHPAFINGTIY